MSDPLWRFLPQKQSEQTPQRTTINYPFDGVVVVDLPPKESVVHRNRLRRSSQMTLPVTQISQESFAEILRNIFGVAHGLGLSVSPVPPLLLEDVDFLVVLRFPIFGLIFVGIISRTAIFVDLLLVGQGLLDGIHIFDHIALSP